MTDHGLTEAEAQTRLSSEGPNELPRSARRTPLRIVMEVLRELMLALLLAGGAVCMVLLEGAKVVWWFGRSRMSRSATSGPF